MRRNPADHRDELVNELIAARSQIMQLISALPHDQQDVPFIGTWCIKDLLAHLIGWDFTNIEAVREILAGQRPTFFRHYDKDWQSYNALLVRTYRKEPFEALLAECEDSHQQLITLLRSLPAQDLLNGKSNSKHGRTITIRNLLRSEANDERQHAQQVQEFLQQNAQPAHP